MHCALCCIWWLDLFWILCSAIIDKGLVLASALVLINQSQELYCRVMTTYIPCPSNVSVMFWHPKWSTMVKPNIISCVRNYQTRVLVIDVLVWNLFWKCMNKWNLTNGCLVPKQRVSKFWTKGNILSLFLIISFILLMIVYLNIIIPAWKNFDF